MRPAAAVKSSSSTASSAAAAAAGRILTSRVARKRPCDLGLAASSPFNPVATGQATWTLFVLCYVYYVNPAKKKGSVHGRRWLCIDTRNVVPNLACWAQPCGRRNRDWGVDRLMAFGGPSRMA